MKLKSISFKLFAVTGLVFIGCLTIMLALQLHYFEPYYVRDKTDGFLAAFEENRQRLLREAPETTEVPSFFSRLEEEYYAISALVTLKPNSWEISAGKGISGSAGKVSLRIVNPDAAMNRSRNTPSFRLPEPPLGLSYPNAEMEKLMAGIEQWYKNPERREEVLVRGGRVSFIADIATTGGQSRQFVVAAPVRLDNGAGTLMIAVSSLQPVGDAMDAFRSFYPYFYLLAVAGILLLALLYSRMIAQPLLTLNRTAQRMAKLDFREKSGMRRSDEIGSLSDTLNFLSENLDQALSELHEANAKLQADIEKEKRLEQSRREFVAGVSHELKTPVSLIGGFAEALQDNVGNGQKRERYASIIREEAARMAGIVNDMLDLSQMESGQYTLHPERFRLDRLIGQTADKLQEHPGNEGLRMETELAEIAVTADRFRIEQVLSNLLSNALRHTPPGGRLGIRLKADHEEARVVVWNEGEPIPPEELGYIWDHFYRVEKARQREGEHRKGGGTGIGLAIVRQIIGLHGGRCGVRNVPGGVEFMFTIPAGDGDEDDG
ncbi:cell wall metabolism sensor histidine kinase WalK [Paenibacillus sp. YN15]|uniref:sensor histidine kinase n=1 Tax=Paenibacillus sp. YN15 TaxID=1742774 RepID=UPI000DCC8A93|nr:HAMP domain-containing sensor histidine kinase [Paenibacillus sp. YN15]RAU94885.1 hypothetical protein DQG13_22970 [Paenibacillus sp. YN15]